LLYGAGACVIATGAIMYFTKSEAEDQWDKYENNNSSDISLSFDLGFKRITPVSLKANILNNNVQPCLTVRLSF
jgi:hypothetical protein